MQYYAVVLIPFIMLTSPSYSQDTVHVKTGWNIIGSVKAGAVPDVLSTIPDSLISSSIWGYAPGVGYESTDTLDNGVGYWVKVKDDGVIVFNTTPVIDTCKSKAFIYEGKLYHTVLIGNQCWMAENLDVGTMVTGVTDQTDNDTTEKYCYNNDPLNCALYGGLYQWEEAMHYVITDGAQGICPPGWHIPTNAEFNTLATTVSTDANALKAVGQGTGGGAGTNLSGFSALLAGGRWTDGSFHAIGQFTYVWGSKEPGWGPVLLLRYDGNSIGINMTISPDFGHGVRCLED